MPNKRSTGLDNMPTPGIKNGAHCLHYPILIVLKKIYESGLFPDTLKITKIVPVSKVGKNSIWVGDYKQIAILSPLAKVIESTIYMGLLTLTGDRIKQWQHGFIKGRSIVTNLLTFLEYTTQALAEGHQVDVIYTDFTKAFDTVRHEILLQILLDLGLPWAIVNIVKSYLTNRTMHVSVDRVLSEGFTLSTGVPQGSNLGPLLFILYVNQLDDRLTCQYLMYADDAKLYYSVTNEGDCQVLQNNFNKFMKLVQN